MAIYDILNNIKDRRQAQDSIAYFNGFLEDYLALIEISSSNDSPVFKSDDIELLNKIFEYDNNLKIIVDLGLNINKKAVANQIIRYKDAYKLPDYSINIPYIIYGEYEDMQRAMIIVPGGQEAYIKAKALYYVISEPENEYEGTRNEIIASSLANDSLESVLLAMNAFFKKNAKAGEVQRNLDLQIFKKYADMYVVCNEMANKQIECLDEVLKDENTTQAVIYKNIANWFLLKKFVYVQYMMDKSTLNQLHERNVKKQRAQAKINADEIPFVSFSELWRKAKELQKKP